MQSKCGFSNPQRANLLVEAAMDEAEFDRFADEYYAQHSASIRMSGEAPEYFHRYKIEVVQRECDRLRFQPRRILDFGGGVGNSIPYMKALFETAEIALIDPSRRSLDVARERHGALATLTHFDGATIPFADGQIDLAFVACVFHHIPHDLHGKLLGELERVLVPGGHLFVFEHNPLNPLTLKAVRDCPFDENAVLISARNMKQRIRSAGFVSALSRFTVFFPHALKVFRPAEPWLGRIPIGGQYFVHAIKGADR